MKKDRNCSGATPYPIYPNYGPMPMNPMMAGPMPGYGMPVPTTISSGSTSNYNDELSRLKEQMQNLERRVSRLESMVSNKTTSFGSNQYSDANYHIM